MAAQKVLIDYCLEQIPEGLGLTFLRPNSTEDLALLNKKFNLKVEQGYFPIYTQIQKLGITTTPKIAFNSNSSQIDNICFLGTRYKQFNLSNFYRILDSLVDGSSFLTSFENNLGASSYEKKFKELYNGEIISFSKSKCRVFGILNFQSSLLKLNEEQKLAAKSEILFNKGELDKGSSLLIETLNDILTGEVLELCSGAGALTKELILTNPKISKILSLEAEYSSIEYAKQTIKNSTIEFEWGDATKISSSGIMSKKYSSIILNPPFHSDLGESRTLGKTIIQTAISLLKDSGRLFVVQNNHIPYRKELKLYENTKVLCEKNGFIVWSLEK